MWFWIFYSHKTKTLKKIKKLKKKKKKKNANAICTKCMKGPTKIEGIRSRTKRAKAQP